MEVEVIPSRKLFLTNYPEFRYWKKRHVENLNDNPPLSIYVHIPFCFQKCAFCYYLTLKYEDHAQLNKYVDAICKEIKIVTSKYDFSNREIDSIYFGGGTPGILKKEQLSKIIETLDNSFKFSNPEITIEISPNLVNENKIKTLDTLGFNRISMGVQSFDNDILKLSKRKHNNDQAKKATKLLLTKSNAIINIDLLSGLAGESEESWQKSLDEAIGLKVHNITVYKMQTYLNTNFYKYGVRDNQISLPTDDTEIEFMKIAIDKFFQNNYKPLTYFTYSLDGKYHHNYVNSIWNRGDLYSFGISGFGNIGNLCFQNTRAIEKYYTQINNFELPVSRGYKLSMIESAMRYIILRMKLCTLDLTEFKKYYGFDMVKIIPEAIDNLIKENYIVLEKNILILTQKGLLFGDYPGVVMSNALRNYFKVEKFLI